MNPSTTFQDLFGSFLTSRSHLLSSSPSLATAFSSLQDTLQAVEDIRNCEERMKRLFENRGFSSYVVEEELGRWVENHSSHLTTLLSSSSSSNFEGISEISKFVSGSLSAVSSSLLPIIESHLSVALDSTCSSLLQDLDKLIEGALLLSHQSHKEEGGAPGTTSPIISNDSFSTAQQLARSIIELILNGLPPPHLFHQDSTNHLQRSFSLQIASVISKLSSFLSARFSATTSSSSFSPSQCLILTLTPLCLISPLCSLLSSSLPDIEEKEGSLVSQEQVRGAFEVCDERGGGILSKEECLGAYEVYSFIWLYLIKCFIRFCSQELLLERSSSPQSYHPSQNKASDMRSSTSL